MNRAPIGVPSTEPSATWRRGLRGTRGGSAPANRVPRRRSAGPRLRSPRRRSSSSRPGDGHRPWRGPPGARISNQPRRRDPHQRSARPPTARHSGRPPSRDRATARSGKDDAARSRKDPPPRGAVRRHSPRPGQLPPTRPWPNRSARGSKPSGPLPRAISEAPTAPGAPCCRSGDGRPARRPAPGPSPWPACHPPSGPEPFL